MIRQANIKDLDAIMKVMSYAREYMKANSNPTQWGDDYPSEEVLKNDIAQKELYVYEVDNVIHAAFVIMQREDPCYNVILDGAWEYDEEYAAIHRVASAGTKKGVVDKIMEYAKEIFSYIRIDTHENNHIMKHLILKHGFKRSGKIYACDETLREAYEYKKMN